MSKKKKAQFRARLNPHLELRARVYERASEGVREQQRAGVCELIYVSVCVCVSDSEQLLAAEVDVLSPLSQPVD